MCILKKKMASLLLDGAPARSEELTDKGFQSRRIIWVFKNVLGNLEELPLFLDNVLEDN